MELSSALEEILRMDGVDPYPYPYPHPHPTPNNSHIHLEHAAGDLCLEDDMLAVYEAFYPNICSTISPNDHGLMAAYPPLPPDHISSHQLPVLQAQQQFQPHHRNNCYWEQQQKQQILPRKGTGIRKKKKTEQLKTVYRVPADNILTVDKWAWRKYGQKPIKGSPFPRNYYRCSSSKGCSARKQVERSVTEAEMYIVTYTGDHFHPWPLHRNALAGISRSDHHKNGSPTPQLQAPAPAPAAAPEGEALLIPNSKNVDEDMLRGMEQLAKWNRSHTSTLAFY